MGKGEPRLQNGKQIPGDLESYRRLIAVQKQVVEMSKQHEQSRRECDALREQVARELLASLHQKAGGRPRLRHSAIKLLQRLSRGDALGSSLRALKSKLLLL